MAFYACLLLLLFVVVVVRACSRYCPCSSVSKSCAGAAQQQLQPILEQQLEQHVYIFSCVLGGSEPVSHGSRPRTAGTAAAAAAAAARAVVVTLLC